MSSPSHLTSALLLLSLLGCVETVDLRSDGEPAEPIDATSDTQDGGEAMADLGTQVTDAGVEADGGEHDPDLGFFEDAEPQHDAEPDHPDAEPPPEDAGLPVSDCEAEGADCVEPIEATCPEMLVELELSCLTEGGQGEGLICCVRE